MSDATATTTATGTVSGISDAQKTANLHVAVGLVATQLGINPISQDYNQRLKFDRALSLVITKYPERFSDTSVANAKASLKKNFTPLDDTSFSLSDFGTLFVDNAVDVGKKVGSIGTNALGAVTNTFSVLKYALPVILVGGLGLFVYLKAKR